MLTCLDPCSINTSFTVDDEECFYFCLDSFQLRTKTLVLNIRLKIRWEVFVNRNNKNKFYDPFSIHPQQQQILYTVLLIPFKGRQQLCLIWIFPQMKALWLHFSNLNFSLETILQTNLFIGHSSLKGSVM